MNLPDDSGCMLLRKRKKRVSLLFRLACNHQIVLPFITGSWFSSLAFSVPRHKNLYKSINSQRSGVQALSTTKAVVSHVKSRNDKFACWRSVQFSHPGQIPV